MKMKQQEKILMQRIAEYGLVRDVVHKIYDTSVVHGEILIKGETKVYLYEKKVFDEKKRKRDDSVEGYVSFGVAYCSNREHNFSRRQGRLVATGRAVKAFERTLV